MRVGEYAACDATALAELMRRGEVTAEEVYASAVEAINAVNAHINAVADGPWQQPLDYATDGVFAGVPFVLKDLGNHARGIPVRSGSRLSADGVVRPSDSFLIRKFRDAGLAIAGLTTTPEIGFNTNTEALIYGSTRNPWALGRSAGGSSGGTAALVAAGGVPVGHGGDGGGSIRIPAACNGLVGLKPSRGRTSNGPELQEALAGFGIEFVLTRTLRDCAAILDRVAVPMPGDKYLVERPRRAWVTEIGASPGRLRIAVCTASWSSRAVDPEVAAAVQRVGQQLEAMGHHVDRATPTVDWDTFIEAQVPIFAAWNADAVETLAEASGNRPGPQTLEHAVLASYEYGRQLTALQIARAMRTVNAVMRMVGRFFTEWDLLITPTMNVPPLPLGYHDANDPSLSVEGWVRHIFDVCSFTALFNWTGTPAMSLPLAWSSGGLPIGVQLAAPMCQEATLFQVGAQLEAALPWSMRRPAVHAATADLAPN